MGADTDGPESSFRAHTSVAGRSLARKVHDLKCSSTLFATPERSTNSWHGLLKTSHRGTAMSPRLVCDRRIRRTVLTQSKNMGLIPMDPNRLSERTRQSLAALSPERFTTRAPARYRATPERSTNGRLGLWKTSHRGTAMSPRLVCDRRIRRTCLRACRASDLEIAGSLTSARGLPASASAQTQRRAGKSPRGAPRRTGPVEDRVACQ